MARCLILERHPWETGFNAEQLQVPKQSFTSFFGAAGGPITVHLHTPFGGGPVITNGNARAHAGNSTYRLENMTELGAIPASFVFIEEQTDANGVVTHYDVWYREDKAYIVHFVTGTYGAMSQARGSQHGRGRLHKIVNAPVQRNLGNR